MASLHSKHLSLILHAFKCMHRLSGSECHLVHCKTMRDVFNHLRDCRQDNDCPNGTAVCHTTLKLIHHWNRCHRTDCPLCQPNRSAIHTKAMMSLTEPQTSRATGDELKEWHTSVGHHMRQSLSKMMAQSMTDNSVSDGIGLQMDQLIDSCSRIESGIFQSADSREQYYYLCAQKVYDIQRLRAEILKEYDLKSVSTLVVTDDNHMNDELEVLGESDVTTIEELVNDFELISL
ncbi:unnamed protein product [Oppiella nova]|uniref:histone acetyltransferase n=1 Tax=Oppiella nova TaxID=334625 RepID=A0A7R9LR55_9ACAR|nr:unnamed protein product [Oppiella nova]CAG2166173.1 unnamed protein product [Oppiella nova]